MRVLLIEDDAADQKLMVDALAHCAHDVHVDVAVDGEQGLAAVRRQPLPSLIILDINTPRMDGRVFLKEIKSDPVTRVIPAIVLSGVDDVETIEECYQNHANAYLVKPDSLDGYWRLADRVLEFWLREARLSS